jgi:(p)ppGpp synthase/HD superfamily hydrolase
MIELTPERILESKAKRFAIKAHGEQGYGDSGKPYSYHLEQVVANVKLRMKGNPLLSTYIAVAWLHDTIEDTGVTFQDIEREFGMAIAYSVLRLTKMEGEDYNTYIYSCITNAIAREVKICDTMANLTESFMSGNEKGLAKYPKQLDMLLKGVVE